MENERTTLEPIHQRGDLRPLVHDQAFWLIPEGLSQLPSGVVGRSQNAESGATCSRLRVETARRSVGSQSASEDRISGLNGDFDWTRTRIDGINRARAWSGLVS